MITKRDLVVAIFSFCLTATLFMIIPTESRVGYYDHWIDFNDDGKIDMKDVAEVARAFGSLGDPINKTELLLDLQERVEALEASGLPAPDYASNWISINREVTLTHNLGTANVLVHIQGYNIEWYGIHQINYGGDRYHQYDRLWSHGAYWWNLTSETITVVRGGEDPIWDQIQVRLWIIQP